MSAPRGRVLMVQGTASSVGKSTLVTALCRLFARQGWRVAPFKAQNMALNSFVTLDGGEIGRSTAVQARAAGIEPTVEMNPLLLKPEAEARSQLIVLGRAVGRLSAAEYYRDHEEFVFALADALRIEYETIANAGFLVQVDDAWLAALWDRIGVKMGLAEYKKYCMMRVAALNHALANVPEERIRYHLCWGS